MLIVGRTVAPSIGLPVSLARTVTSITCGAAGTGSIRGCSAAFAGWPSAPWHANARTSNAVAVRAMPGAATAARAPSIVEPKGSIMVILPSSVEDTRHECPGRAGPVNSRAVSPAVMRRNAESQSEVGVAALGPGASGTP